MQAAADTVSKATGGSLDILIPNAGIGGDKHRFKTLPNFPSLEDLEEELNETFSVNVSKFKGRRALKTNLTAPLSLTH